MDYSKYKKMFIDETMENLNNINETLDVFEQDNKNQEAIQKLFRSFHSIKGMAASLDYRQIQEMSHKLEDLLDGIRSGKIDIRKEILEILYEGSSILEKLVRILEDESEEHLETGSFMDRLITLSVVKSSTDTVSLPTPPISPEAKYGLSQNDLAELEKVKKNQFKAFITISKESISPPARAYLLLESFKEVSDILKTIPTQDDIGEGNMGRSFAAFLGTDVDQSKIEGIIKSSIEIEKFTINRMEVASEERNGEPTKLLTRSPDRADKEKDIRYRKPGAVKVGTQALDSLIDIVGEMFIQENQLRDIAKSLKSPKTVDSINQLEKLVRKLHKEVMTLRLVPISLLTDMIPRIIRETLRGSNKKVDLIVEGKDIKLDRSIVEKLGDPVIHLIRNSLDHGIESPEDRTKIEKPETAKLTFAAVKEGDSIIIELSDDGRGLNIDKIKEKIIANGLATAETIEKIDDQGIYNYVWQPGFSTAEQVTSVSGRGVGMDIVKSAVEGLSGKISVASNRGKGCKFILQVPLTIAIIKTFRIRLEKDIYAIPTGNILHTIELPADELKDQDKKLYFYYRDEKILVCDLRSLLKYETNGIKEKKTIPIIVVNAGSGDNNKLGLIVDSFLSIHDTVVKSLGKPLEKFEVFSGSTMSEKGDIILILDLDKLLASQDRFPGVARS